jgi:hypothetical protein
MQIDTNLARAFNKAVTNLDNFREGKPDWDFIDADVYMDCANYGNAPGNYIEQFNYLGDCYTNHISPRDRIINE